MADYRKVLWVYNYATGPLALAGKRGVVFALDEESAKRVAREYTFTRGAPDLATLRRATFEEEGSIMAEIQREYLR